MSGLVDHVGRGDRHWRRYARGGSAVGVVDREELGRRRSIGGFELTRQVPGSHAQWQRG